MKTNIIIPVLAALCIQTHAQVRFTPVDSHLPFAEMISGIELIPLDTDEVNMLRTDIWCKHGDCPVPEEPVHSQGPELILAEDSYLLVDPGQDRTYRYSWDGRFLNSIGNIDEGKEKMTNAQLLDDGLYVYAYPGAVRRYRLDGTEVRSEKVEDIGSGGWTVKEGLLTWYGYGSGRPGRLALWNGMDSTTFLPTSAKVLHFDLGLPVFTQNGKAVTFIDGTRSTVMIYRNGKASRHLDIDLGEFAIADSYYEHEDSMEAALEMMSKTFGIVERYVQDRKYGFMEIMIQTPEGKVTDYYGIMRKGEWTWFSPGTINEHPFANSFRTIKGKTLYCILNPDILKNMQDELKAKITTPLETSADDFIIAKVHLK